MDLREIQRLHAQFAPDTVTIDLPRQIAALPGPASERRNPSDGVGDRWLNAGPLFRRCTISIVAAAVLGSAGVGAAVLYRSLRTINAPGAVVSDVRGELLPARVASSQKSPAKLREIVAAEPTPVSEAPVLSASDLSGTMPRGLTADQFRHNLGSHAAPTQSSQSAGSSEEQLAMVSPIRRPSERVPQLAATSSAPTVVETVPKAPSAVSGLPAPAATGQPVTQQIVVGSPGKAGSPTAPASTKDEAPVVSAAPAVAASSPTPKAARAVHHRTVKNHVAHPDPDATSSSDRSKPALSPAKAPGSNEVQML
jgi:hypothetical protein